VSRLNVGSVGSRRPRRSKPAHRTPNINHGMFLRNLLRLIQCQRRRRGWCGGQDKLPLRCIQGGKNRGEKNTHIHQTIVPICSELQPNPGIFLPILFSTEAKWQGNGPSQRRPERGTGTPATPPSTCMLGSQGGHRAATGDHTCIVALAPFGIPTLPGHLGWVAEVVHPSPCSQPPTRHGVARFLPVEEPNPARPLQRVYIHTGAGGA
jgi:hypothetical protein